MKLLLFLSISILYIHLNNAFKLNYNNHIHHNRIDHNNNSNEGLLVYSFTSNSEIIVIDIINNKLIVNQTLPQPYYINNINSINNNKITLFVQNPNNRNCFITEYDIESNSFNNNSKSIRLKDKFEFLAQPYYYDAQHNNYYLPVQLDRFKKDVLSVLNWNFNSYKLNSINFKEIDYNTNYYPLGTFSPSLNQYLVMFFSNGDSNNPYIQSFNFDNSSSNSKLYNFSNNSNGTSADSANLLLTTSTGNTLVISNYVNHISISSIDFNHSQIKFEASFEYGSYQNNFPAYFYNSNSNNLVIMDGVVDNSEFILFKFVNLDTFKITQSYKSKNYYKDLPDGAIASLFTLI